MIRIIESIDFLIFPTLLYLLDYKICIIDEYILVTKKYITGERRKRIKCKCVCVCVCM